MTDPCNVCRHPWPAHVETLRYWSLLDERRRGRCEDCPACWPPDDTAAVSERQEVTV